MVTLTVKIPKPLGAGLDALVKERKQTKSALVREAIEKLVATGNRPSPSVYDLAKDLCGIGEGPADLATNPKYMEGYGE